MSDILSYITVHSPIQEVTILMRKGIFLTRKIIYQIFKIYKIKDVHVILLARERERERKKKRGDIGFPK